MGERDWVVSPEFAQRLGIRAWLRCKDDTFDIYENLSEFKSFLEKFRQRICGAWSFKVEQVSRHEVVMLDMQVQQKGAWPDDEGGASIITKPYFMPSARNTPSRPTSAHPQGQSSWPTADIRRIPDFSMKQPDVAKAGYKC